MNVAILNRDSHCPHLLSIETTAKGTVDFEFLILHPSILKTVLTVTHGDIGFQMTSEGTYSLRVTLRERNVTDRKGHFNISPSGPSARGR